ncbi:MAG: class I tRNA ligase family protein, partial [Patescibacteria group bacterium]
YRLRDHGFKKGDTVMFRNSQTGEIFGTAEIMDVAKTTVGQIPLNDSNHGAKYERREQLIAAFQRHNPSLTITEDTEAFIYTYKFTALKTEENEKTQIPIMYYVHGTTVDNEAKKSSGHYDAALSKLGMRQSRELKKIVKDERYDVVFCSDLQRAVDTAKIAFGDKAVIIKDKRLREIDYGELTRTGEEQTAAMKNNAIEQSFPKGESYRDVGRRISDFLYEVATKYAGKRIAIVAHQAPQLALEVLLNGKTWEKAIEEDWRHTKAWQPGWHYTLPALIYVGGEKPAKGWQQDTDVLDTWFSSGMWTFSTLGWPKKTADLKNYHPTQVLETGYEIITLWVSRMIMMSLFALNEIPFANVYLHGMVLDMQGKKMSKSKGNGIDPLEMIKKYGTDATRMSLVVGNTPGNDMRMSEQKIADFRNFANKLWNIARYIILFCHSEERSDEESIDPSLPAVAQDDKKVATRSKKMLKEYTLADKWILGKMNSLIKDVADDIEHWRFSQAGERLRDFTWNDLADWYLEVSKFEATSEKNKILNLVLGQLLKLWHPFMPFVTEAIWQELGQENLLMVEPWPTREAMPKLKTSAQFDLVINVIKTIRNLRSEYKISPAQPVKVIIYAGGQASLLQSQAELIKNLRTGVSGLIIKPAGEKLKQAAWAAVNKIEIYIPLAGLIDMEREKERLEKHAQELNKLIKSLEVKLDNEEFVKRAPKEIVETDIAKLANYRSEHKQLKEQMKHLK